MMTSTVRSLALRYAWPIAASALALLLALVLEPLIEPGPFLPFLAAVVVSAWYGGLGPGLLATGIGVLASSYIFLVPTSSLQIASLNAAVQVAVFALVAFLISSLNANLRAAHRRAEAARSDAEQAQRRLAFLGEATTRLNASLDYEETLQSLACLVVPDLADWCVIHITVEEGGATRRLTVANGDRDKERLARELQQCDLLDSSGLPGVQRVLATGKPALYPDASTALVRCADGEAHHLRLLRMLGYRSAMIVPLVAGGRTLGGITFVSAHSARPYGQDNLALAEELARRAALAVDHARLYREAHEAVRVRDEFLAGVSHDLRNPLTAIKGQVQLMLRDVGNGDGRGSESLRKGLARVDASATKMSKLIDQLLDHARFQTGELLDLDREATDLVALAQQAAIDHQHATGRHRIRVESPETPIVGIWDAARLERVLDNLLANAIKYSPRGGEILLTVARDEDPSDGSAVLSISDQGVGIPATELDRVFERFYRASNVPRQIRGNGIGLAGTRQLVEQHGGSITVESHEGVGTTFTVRLPLSADSAGRAWQPAERARS
jgi:K+-sensing histidine kinase KdpD